MTLVTSPQKAGVFKSREFADVIYIGIDKTDKVVGVTDADSDALKIKDRIKNNISPSAMGLFDVVVEDNMGWKH